MTVDPPTARGDRSNVRGFVNINFGRSVVRVLVKAKRLEPNTLYRVNIVQSSRDCSIELFNDSFTTNRKGKGTLRVSEQLVRGGPGVLVKVDLPDDEAFGTDHVPEPS